jgi:hypothetical protein
MKRRAVIAERLTLENKMVAIYITGCCTKPGMFIEAKECLKYSVIPDFNFGVETSCPD